MDITRAKIRDLRKALDSKQISAVELCGEYFKNIEAGDGQGTVLHHRYKGKGARDG